MLCKKKYGFSLAVKHAIDLIVIRRLQSSREVEQKKFFLLNFVLFHQPGTFFIISQVIIFIIVSLSSVCFESE